MEDVEMPQSPEEIGRAIQSLEDWSQKKNGRSWRVDCIEPGIGYEVALWEVNGPDSDDGDFVWQGLGGTVATAAYAAFKAWTEDSK